MILKQKKIKFKRRTKFNHNIWAKPTMCETSRGSPFKLSLPKFKKHQMNTWLQSADSDDDDDDDDVDDDDTDDDDDVNDDFNDTDDYDTDDYNDVGDDADDNDGDDDDDDDNGDTDDDYDDDGKDDDCNDVDKSVPVQKNLSRQTVTCCILRL